ncbi:MULTISPECIES: DNA polymerase III subunit gamma and tau [unclassified Microbacterium]|uniref:DNA polymerase III subunit gamma and tau n=1 Tax=unclassified Microbacterium TaxID=2609290 RepID=UPI001D6CCE87|nr:MULTISPECIES: DNA polymerase III subunit gamma and tau [unclassified Microbacterium]CAH0195045.1 DNA polymerase III subunit gamma/tau [Microbacterium sp. Bi121]HWK78309.1 DNA polymerase III subunit gamma and tau [Microbacterium sp.]
MTTALYRRYRPENFGEMIGQSQVTDPLMTALRSDRVGHAYLFSGPRGCGKTTSARILARCLNCAEGPTDTPCGTCPSCVELSRAGGGSLDVVEIDAASHNGVDDARDLRERATFAPSRDRFKIFILDEAHMVTPQGFNALLKLVEEPPEHVKFIFATTEPDKVLGTIRSRTHHYPFRLVPPAAMLEYVEKLCVEEGVKVAQGVLPLVVRAGGGSPRDTLSLLDQLIAGSDGDSVAYERAVSLLGYTHGALLDEIVDALAAGDAAAAFPAIDRVVQTGQDPRRFVDDLLERLRDLIVIAAVGDGASAVLRGLAEDELARMRTQASVYGAARLSRTADVVSAALDDMTGATSPRLHLELMIARVLSAAGQGSAQAAPAQAAPAPAAPAQAAPAPTESSPRVVERASEANETKRVERAERAETSTPTETSAPAETSAPTETSAPAASTPAETPAPASTPSGPVDIDRIRAVWPAVLTRLESVSRTSWLLVTAVQPLDFESDTDVLTVGFASQQDLAKFKGQTPGSGASDHLRAAIEQELGVKVKYRPAQIPPAALSEAAAPAPVRTAPPAPKPQAAPAAPVTDWAVAAIPADAPADLPAPAESAPQPQFPVDDEPAEVEASAPVAPQDGLVDRDEPPLPGDDEAPPPDDEPPYEPPRQAAEASPRGATPQAQTPVSQAPARMAPAVTERAPGGVQRYGEAVIRQVLGATFVREEPYEPPTRFA